MSARALATSNEPASHLDEVRAAEALIAEVERDRDELRRRARSAIGVGDEGDLTAAEPIGRSTYLVASTSGLAVVAGLPLAVLALLGLPLAAGTGQDADLVSRMAGMFFVGTGIGALLGPAIARSLGSQGDAYARMAFGGSILIAVGLALVGFVTPVGGMSVAGLGAGLSVVGRRTVLGRGAPSADRVRALAIESGGTYAGVVLATIMIGAIAFGTEAPVSTMMLGLGVLVLFGLALATDLVATPVADGDLARLREIVDPAATGDDLPTAEPFRRVWGVATVRGLVVGQMAVGAAAVTLHVHLVRFLSQVTGLGLWGRGAVHATVCLAALAAVRLSAKRDAVRVSDDPGRLVGAASSALAAGGVALGAAALWPWYSQVVLLLAGFAFVAVAHAQMDSLVLVSVRPRLRGHATALTTAVTSLAGGALAVPVLSAVARRAEMDGVLLATAVVLVLASAAVRRTRDRVASDVDAAVNDEIETAQVAMLVQGGSHLPLLAVRHVNFSYGTVQVLFDVSFSVDDGEMVGLLGTNGAGKSTLLRVISGLGTPTSGTVRHRGEDITYLDPAARVGRGITQIPGGKAVFGPLSVVDNLRVYGHSLGRDRRALDQGIELALETFPRLAERRNLPSRVLSGGERQMLALSKALILQPRLLLIDELSLGLAPVIVGELLAMVRRINERGTAVVLVEQSVNVALSLVDHAYYMEKGEIKFDGVAEDLLSRPDLLRSVYLQGAAEGLA